MRYPLALFIACWLGGWWFGFTSAFQSIISGKAVSFVFFWLIGWSVGGCMAAYYLWLLIRPTVPESLRLEYGNLTYDTGRFPICGQLFSTNLASARAAQAEALSSMFRSRKVYHFTRADAPEFLLEGSGENQRLRFDNGADRVVIGRTLKEPEREWLNSALQSWKRS